VTATWVGGDAATANALSVNVTIPGSAAAGDIAWIAAPYNPTLGTASISGGGGTWTSVSEVTWTGSFHSILYRRTLTSGDIGATITISNTGSQKLTAALGVLRGVTAQDSFASANEASVVTSHTAPSFTAGTTDVALAFWTERESAPSTSITSAPSGFTLQNSAFATGSGATCAAVASNLTPVTTGGTVGGGSWVENTANDAVVMFVVGATVDTVQNATASLAATATIAATASVTRSATASLAATATVVAAVDPIPAGVWRGGDAQQFNGTSISVTIPANVKAGDIGLIAHPYSPNVTGGVDPTTPTGWTQIDTQTFGASFHARLYAKTLTLADASTTVTFTNGAQKLAAALAVIGGCSGIDVQNFTIESSVVTSHPAPSATAGTSDVAVAFITERESTPSTAFTAPSGFTLRNSAFNVLSGATSVGVASNLTAVAPGGTVGGGNWVADVANDALIMWVVGLTISPVANGSASLAVTATTAATAAVSHDASASRTATATISASASASAGTSAALTSTATILAEARVVSGLPAGALPPRRLRIDVYDENLNQLGRIGEYMNADVTLKHNQVGSWSLLLDIQKPNSLLLAAPGRRAVISFEPQNQSDPVEFLCSGPVATWEENDTVGELQTLSVAGYDDKVWLDRRIAYPSPGATFPAEGTAFNQAAYQDSRTGTGESVAKAFVNAANARLPIPHLTVATSLGRGTSVTFAARMHQLLWMVFISCTYSGLGFDVKQINGQLVFDVYVPQEQPVRLSKQLGNLTSFKYRTLAPKVTDAIAGGTGEGTARDFMQKSAADGGWGTYEAFLDASDADTDAILLARLNAFLTEGAATAGFSLVPRDTQAMRFGRDYNLGDRVRVEGSNGFILADTVRQVDITHSVENGVVITPGIGYTESTEPTAAIYRTYKRFREDFDNFKRSI
jgi:hypothetical protein